MSVKDQNAYNLKLIQAGYALPYFIYPNAVSPTKEGEWNYDTLQEFRNATVEAEGNNLGIWRCTLLILCKRLELFSLLFTL